MDKLKDAILEMDLAIDKLAESLNIPKEDVYNLLLEYINASLMANKDYTSP